MRSIIAKYIYIVLAVLIFVVSIYSRIKLFPQEGSDLGTYEEAVSTFVEGKNPYIDTVKSFEQLDKNPGGKGFSYLPGLLYINGFFYSIHLYLKTINPCNELLQTGFCTPLVYFWKIPILFADIGIGLLILKIMWPKSKFAAIFALAAWYFNAFFVLKRDFISNDPLPTFFMLLGLYYLRKDDVISGSAYAFSVALKTFPIFLAPIFLILAKDKIKLLVSAGIVGLALSAPFMTSVNNFVTYMKGAVFVHGNRFMQGRPFLFYISYRYSIELVQIIPLKVYTYIASFGGWIIASLFAWRKWITSRYTLSVIPFVIFYAFTPVLNRTYLLWALPLFIIGIYEFFKNKSYIYYVFMCVYWYFYYWYLAQWEDGFHIHARL